MNRNRKPGYSPNSTPARRTPGIEDPLQHPTILILPPPTKDGRPVAGCQNPLHAVQERDAESRRRWRTSALLKSKSLYSPRPSHGDRLATRLPHLPFLFVLWHLKLVEPIGVEPTTS
jgi:hypothetical protein